MSNVRWLVALLAAMALFPAWAVAQERGTITGTVVDQATQRPLPGAQVSVVGTQLGTITNQQGRFLIPNVPAGEQTVRVTLIGYSRGSQTVQVAAGETVTLNFTLSQTAVELEGVVVTALGIEREQRALGVASQQISSEQLTRVEPNIVNSLSGKVSGVQITNAGPQGGSSRIVIRGASSITGNNQPLFVIDGVPVDNSAPRLRGYGGYDYGNAVQDLNPENIESVTILKGPNAAALYGSRAANGAVIITTRSGRAAAGGQVTASQVVTFETPLRLPNYQNQFGQGVFGLFSWENGDGDGTFDYFDESWGPPLDGRLICQFNSPRDAQGNCQPTPWVARPNNVRNFFETGRTLTTNAAFAVGTEQANARLSVSRQGIDGMVPGFELERLTLGLTGGLQVSERLRTETSVQYITSDAERRPGIGYELSNPMIQFVWFGRQVDVEDLRRNYRTRRPENDPQAGMPYSWNYRYHPNPYYIIFENNNFDNRDRLIGQLSATYELTPWLSAMLRTGTDWYQDDRKFTYAQDLWGMSGFDPRAGAETRAIGANGAFGEWNIGHQETNTDFLLSANPQLEGAVSLNASLGASRRDYRRSQRFIYVSDLTAPGVYSVTNARNTPDPWDWLDRKRVNSLLGQAEIGFNNYFFVTVTGRNDWSSTLPEDNRSYFYPSVSTSLVFTDLFPQLQDSPLSFGKLRASWARVGNDTDPYNLRNTFAAQDPFQGFPTFTVPNTLANANLKPETTESWEFGAELGFLDGRLGLDVTYYDATTRDQIMPVQISRASGYTGQYVNAGAVQNRGVEMLLSATPVQTPDFSWETSINFARNRNTVVSLAEGVTGLQLPGGSFWGVNVFARVGEPYGQLMGRKYLRDSQGRIVVNANGLPQASATNEVIGNYQPDWTGGWSNTLRFRNLSLNFLLDTQQGGDLYSVTHMFGRYAGVLAETLEGRCRMPSWPVVEGIPVCDANTGIIVPGVKVVNGDTVPNDIVTNAQDYNWALYGIHEAHVFDASFVKLREVTLSYEVPTRFTERMRLSGMNVSLIGRNLALWTDMPHIDPETAFDASNVQGLEFGQLPTARSFGFSVNIRP